MMFSDSKLTRDTDLSKLTELVNSKRIYSGHNLGKYVSEQKNNYKRRVTLQLQTWQMMEDLFYLGMTSRTIESLAIMNEGSMLWIQLIVRKSLRTYPQRSFSRAMRSYYTIYLTGTLSKALSPTSADVYSNDDMDRVHSLWTPKNKFETFLKLKKRDMGAKPKTLLPTMLGLDGKPLGVNEDKTRGMALLNPIPNPLEVIKDDDGIIRPAFRPKKVVIPPNITPVYDPVEFPDALPLIIPRDIDSADSLNRYDGDVRDDVIRDFTDFNFPPPSSPELNLPEVPTHIPMHTPPPPPYEVEDEEDIARRRENKRHNRILKKLKTAPTPPGDSPQVSDEEEEDDEAGEEYGLSESTTLEEDVEDMSWDDVESYVDTSSTHNFVIF